MSTPIVRFSTTHRGSLRLTVGVAILNITPAQGDSDAQSNNYFRCQNTAARGAKSTILAEDLLLQDRIVKRTQFRDSAPNI
jgi:hypothetical protein